MAITPANAGQQPTCFEIAKNGGAKVSEMEKVRAELRKVEPMVEKVGPGVTIEWKGIQDQVTLRSRDLNEPESRLTQLTQSIWVNGVETYQNIPWGTNFLKLDNRPHGQVDYYVEYKRGDKVVHRSSFGLLESKDGQQLHKDSFDQRFAGELLGVEYDPDLKKIMPSSAITSNAVRLSYNKIVWVIKPDATAATHRFIDNAEEGVDVLAFFGPNGEPTTVTVTDKKTGAKIPANASDFFFKVDAAFSGNSFFWDDMYVALTTVAHHPWLVRSTLEFWIAVQKLNGGAIPREVRKSNLRSLFFPDKILYGEEKALPNLVYTNPNLMTWVMDELYRYHPSKENLALLKKVFKSVEDYTQWMETHRAVRDGNQIIGFNGSALGTGADNSRGRIGNRNEPDAYRSGLVDFMAQQIQMYKDLAKWTRIIIDAEGSTMSASGRMRMQSNAARYTHTAQQYRTVMNQRYWNQEKCFYYDIIPNGANGWKHNLNFTVIGGFWPLWAGVPTEEQMKCLIEKQMIAQAFGGDFPFPANARNSIGNFKDPLYVPRPGNQEDGYWDKWAHWPPMVVMAIEGFRRMGRADLAFKYAFDFLKKTAKWSDKTVEESLGEIMKELPNGSVTFDARAIQHSEHTHREDFAGWGKVPPVYMLLVHILGIMPNYQGKLQWNLMIPLDVGQFIQVNNLQYMGHTIKSLKVQRTALGIYELTIESSGEFDIELNLMRQFRQELSSRPIASTGKVRVSADKFSSYLDVR